MELPAAGPLAHVTVALNIVTTAFLIAGYRAIRAGDRETHKVRMVAALISSALFLIVYLVNHAIHGSTPYPFKDWTRTLYFIVLIPHIILAALQLPFILRGVFLAWKQRFEAHARLMRWVWPIWLYVSISGVVVYLALYILPQFRAA